MGDTGSDSVGPSSIGSGELAVLSLVTVRGRSMVPALRHGDRLLARRARSTTRVRAGAVVLAAWPQRPELLAVKRVVRLVPGGYWVEGDNPYGSDDSRTYGPATVRAVVVVRCWRWPPRISATLRR
jgi:nickel-type superoxide dismutase maturation protease